jgi:hypothetical protein
MSDTITPPDTTPGDNIPGPTAPTPSIEVFITAHVFSAINLAFYATALHDIYIAAGTWPSDPVAVTDDNWAAFVGVPPTGKMLGAKFGSPVWLDAPVIILTVQQQAAKLLLAPFVTVVCASQPDLDADYAADTTARSNITGIAAGINAGLGLPSGTSTFNYLDNISGSHFWNAAQFLSFAAQVMVYVYNLTQVSVGIGDALPSNTVTI